MSTRIKDFDQLQKIGQTEHGIIYRARDRRYNRYVTVKQISHSTKTKGIPSNILREISLLKQLSSNKNIITLYEILSSSSDLYLIFEHNSCNFKAYIFKYHKQLNIRQIKNYLFQIISGIYCCHSLKVIHAHLQPNRIMMNISSQTLKITDFGLFIDSNISLTKTATLRYRAPEILAGNNQYHTSCDIFSIGCIFAEIFRKNTSVLFGGNSEIEQLMMIFKILGTPSTDDDNMYYIKNCKYFHAHFPKWKRKSLQELCPRGDLNENGYQLLSRMLTLNPLKRITAKQALKHEWFTIAPLKTDVSTTTMRSTPTTRPYSSCST